MQGPPPSVQTSRVAPYTFIVALFWPSLRLLFWLDRGQLCGPGSPKNNPQRSGAWAHFNNFCHQSPWQLASIVACVACASQEKQLLPLLHAVASEANSTVLGKT